MRINSKNNVSFNGCFRFKNMSQEAQTKLPNLIKKGKIIHNNFQKTGDVVLIVRDKQDDKVLNFIKDNRLNFEFYSKISTELMPTTEKKLLSIMNEIKQAPINTIKAAKEAINERNVKRIQEKSPKHITNILKSLCIENKNPIEKYKGGHQIFDKEFSRTIYISQPSKLNMYYVKVKPISENQKTNRYMIDESGNILATFNTPDAMHLFEKRFSGLLTK